MVDGLMFDIVTFPLDTDSDDNARARARTHTHKKPIACK